MIFATSRMLKLSIALATVALAACSTPVELDKNASGAPVESRTPGGARPGSGVTAVDASQSAAGAGGGSSLPVGAARVIYFDFDSYVIKDEFRPVVETYAKALVANRKLKIAIEGHTDERGGREYNLALGQRRAEAVAKALQLLGAQDGQVEAVSYGKERPSSAGADEAAWAKNRRAELKDR